MKKQPQLQSCSIRNLNIECLRVISMLLIILGHILGHSRVVNEASGIMHYLVSAVSILTLPAVNVYVLISGYFLVESKWNCKRIFMLWAQVFFYSIVCYAVAVASGIVQPSISGAIKAVLPISGNQYWFARVFWCFSLFAPFEAILLRNLTKKQFQLLLMIVVIIFSIWRIVIPFAVTVNNEGGNSIIWFFILFAFSAYLKLHANPKHGARLYAWLFAAAYVLTILGSFVLEFLSNRFGFGGKGTSLLTEYTSITMIGMSVGLFMLFVRLPERAVSARVRNFVMLCSGSTYSVYLIHENQYIKQWLWNKIQPLTWLGSGRFFLYALAAMLGIFIVSTIIDCLTWKKIKRLLVKCKFSALQERIDSFMSQ